MANISFNVPKGADPMGIGGFDLGRSSYDPLQTIREGWQKTREEQLIKDEQRRKEFQDTVSKIPSFEAVNQNVASRLNDKKNKLYNLAERSYKSGAWSPFAKDQETGLNVDKAMSKLENEIATEGSAYNEMLSRYKSAKDFVDNPKNADKIDWQLTEQRMNDFATAKDLPGMANSLTKPLVAIKPDPVNFDKWLKDQVAYYVPGEDKKIIDTVYDPNTDKFKIISQTYKDPNRVADAMIKIYRNAGEEYKKVIDKKFKDATESEKVTSDGVPVKPEDWFASRFVPGYGIKIDLKYVAKSKKSTDKSFDWSNYLPSKTKDGEFDLSKWQEVKSLGYKPAGGTTETLQYNSAATIPLQGVSNKAFIMPNTVNTENADTGESAPQSKSAQRKLDNISILPIANETINFTDGQGNQWTFAPGDKIPKEVQRQMTLNGQADKIRFEAFLTTLTNYSKEPKANKLDLNSGTFEFAPDITSWNSTTITPWKEAKNYVLSAFGKDADMKALDNRINEITNQLNSVQGVFDETIKTKSEEEQFNSLFGQ